MKRIALIIFLIVVSKNLFAQILPIDSVSKKVTFSYINQFSDKATSRKLFSFSMEYIQSQVRQFNRSNSEENYDAASNLLGVRKGKSENVDLLFKIENPLKFNDTSSKKMIGSGVVKYTGGNFGCFRVLYLEFDINIYVKNSKTKLEITNLRYTHYNQSRYVTSQIYGYSDEAPCNSKNTFEEGIVNCTHCFQEKVALYDFLIKDFVKLNNSYFKYVNDQLNKNEEW